MGEQMVAAGRFPVGLDDEGYLRKLHAFYGHPDEIAEDLDRELVLPVATDLLAQFNPGLPTQAAALRALELLAMEVAPAIGWRPAQVAAGNGSRSWRSREHAATRRWDACDVT